LSLLQCSPNSGAVQIFQFIWLQCSSITKTHLIQFRNQNLLLYL
jgi:hypothetical protein